MAPGQCLFLLITVLCSVSSLKNGTPVTLESKFNVEPSRVVPPELTTVASVSDVAKTPNLPPQVAATSDSKIENPSPAKLQTAPDVSAKPYTIIPVTLTITPTLIVPIKLEPEMPEETMAVIEPTSVVKLSTLQTIDVPEVDLVPPKK